MSKADGEAAACGETSVWSEEEGEKEAKKTKTNELEKRLFANTCK